MKIPRIEDLILFEDENIIVLNKPVHITSEKDNAEGGISLADIANRYHPGIMLCHRLDKETSGAIIAAKNEDIYRDFSIMFQERKIHKEYHALVEGIKKFEHHLIDFPLTKKGTFKAVVDKRDGKRAETIVDSIEFFRHYTLVKAEPISGRFHQIRVHLASVGCPLVGDSLYGGKPFLLSQVKRNYKENRGEEETPLMGRAALHAYALRFEYPEGKQFEVIAPYPKDFETTLKMLRKFDEISPNN
jgi:23S rRNA pseudouridine955/2504/2580 synthase